MSKIQETKKTWQTLRSNLGHFFLKNSGIDQTVVKNTVWLSISNFGGRLLKAVVIIYAARVLDPAHWGIFSYALTLAGFFTFFVDPGMNITLIREGSKENEDKKMQFLSTIFYIKLLLIAVAILFIIFIGPYFTTLPGAKALLPIVAVIIVGDTLREFFSSFVRAKEKMEKETVIFLMTNVFIVIFGFVALLFYPSARSFGWAYAIGTILGGIMAIWTLRSYITKIFSNFNSKLIGPIFHTAWPFAITGALGILLTNTDILIISWMRTATDVGVYSAAMRIIQVLYLFPVIIQYSTLPALSRLAVKDTEKFRLMLERVVTVIFIVSVPIAFGGVILGSQIINYVFGPAYISGGPSLMILMISMLVDYPGGVISLAAFAYNKQKILITASVIGGVTNVILDLIFIPRFGITGSAIATLIAQILNNAYLWYAMKKINYFEILPRLKKIILAGICMSIATLILLLSHTGIVANVIISGILYAILLILFREPAIVYINKLIRSGGKTEMANDENKDTVYQ